MKYKIIRLNEKQVKILKDGLLANIRIAGRDLIKRSEEDQKAFDIYRDELFKIYRKLVD